MASVNKNDETLQEYKSTKNNLINEAQTNYNKVSSGAEEKYNELINATKDYGETQAEITQQKTDQTIAEINQNKELAEKDYIKEQKSAYTDYAKQTNAYGTNAEVQASAGLQGSGYSESSRVSMYNTYQNRYATARESYNRAVMNYDNQIAQAQIQNSAQLAEIAFNSLQTQLQLALEGFQYQNDLLNNLLSQKLNISSTYDNLWQSQYNTLLNEAQFNEQMAYQRERDRVADSQWQQQFNLSRAKSSGGGSSKLTSGSSKSSEGKVLKDASGYDEVDKSLENIRKLRPDLFTDNPGSIMEYNKMIDDSTKVLREAYQSGEIDEKEVEKLVGQHNLVKVDVNKWK